MFPCKWTLNPSGFNVNEPLTRGHPCFQRTSAWFFRHFACNTKVVWSRIRIQNFHALLTFYGFPLQWIVPTINNAIKPLSELDFFKCMERLLKLSVSSFLLLLFECLTLPEKKSMAVLNQIWYRDILSCLLVRLIMLMQLIVWQFWNKYDTEMFCHAC